MIKSLITICLLLLFALLTFPISFTQTPANGSSTLNKRWEEFSLPNGQFVISMPAKPTSQSIPVDTKAGGLVAHILALDTELESYVVTYIEFLDGFDQSKSKTILDGMRDKELAKVSGRLVKEGDVEIDSYPGRELTIEVADGFWVDRIYLIRKRLFAVSVFTAKVASAKEITPAQQALLTRYLDSFKLKFEP